VNNLLLVNLHLHLSISTWPDSHPHSITSTKCRINTIVSHDDGTIVARNMQRFININILRANCAPR